MTTANHVTFVGAIRAAAASLGREPSPEQIDNLNLVLRSLGRIDPETGTVTVETDTGIVLVDAYLAREAAAFPLAPTDSSTPPSPVPAVDDEVAGILRVGNGVQHGRHDAFAQIVRATQAGQAAALAREAADWPNPWRAGQINRTHQTVLSRIDPARAAKFRAEAGAP